MSKPRMTMRGNRNMIGKKVERVRKEKHIKQKDLVATLQRNGMDICDSSMSRLEGQNRLVQDFEIPILAEALNVSVQWLLEVDDDDDQAKK